MPEMRVFSLFLLVGPRCVPMPANGCKSASADRPGSAANEVSHGLGCSRAVASKAPETHCEAAAEVSTSRPAGRSCASMWLVFLSKPGSRQVTYDQFQRACSRTRPPLRKPRCRLWLVREAMGKTRGPDQNHESNLPCPSPQITRDNKISFGDVGENQIRCIKSLMFILSKNDDFF